MKIHKEDMSNEFRSYMRNLFIKGKFEEFIYISNENDYYVIYYYLLKRINSVKVDTLDRKYNDINNYFREHISNIREKQILNILS